MFQIPNQLLLQRTLFGIALSALCLTTVASAEDSNSTTQIDFNREIRPIFAAACLQCHGPDHSQRKADLRLDDPGSVFRKRDGTAILVPGHPEQSELYRRITSDDPDQRMPPPGSEKKLTQTQISMLKRWMTEGAKYQTHWAFVPPKRPALPPVSQPDWIRNPIDAFVLARLDQEGLKPALAADKTTLIRRVTLDLTGFPPTPAEVQNYLNDESPEAYERVVDRLLNSPRYGERMALVWLDAARFADSGGYQGDILRSMWLWRDWVIAAYNANKPFDEFTTEQLAGDLLPDPSIDQQIATGFNRNHRINDEDGIILEEFRVEYVADRLETTATVWLGLTIGCARCHDHKYDPISQEEYYSLFAYFNSIDEQGRGNGNAPPLLQVPSEEQQHTLVELARQLKEHRSQLEALRKENAEAPALKKLTDKIAGLEQKQSLLQKQIPNLMVMRELPTPRKTHVLIRGAYQRPGPEVAAGLPQQLSTNEKSYPPNRLGLAQWLLDPGHPLTARVAVNRYWQMYFGRGLVATPEDFGTQGTLPTHPELLDWLATEFIRTNWNVKQMQKLIVTSATYRQSSAGSETLLGRDPENRMLARGARFRLPAEMIRDQALFSSGLLVEKLGGPSVKPYQPAGLWQELASASRDYQQGTGPDLYRRSLYTFIRRTIPPPAMNAFDAPNRELCTVRRARTNTPLQALELMNDPTYVEAARALAVRALQSSENSKTDRLRFAFQSLLARQPTDEELVILQQSLQDAETRYSSDLSAARKLLSVGESKYPETINPQQLAAYTSVCMLLFNLDETITRE